MPSTTVDEVIDFCTGDGDLQTEFSSKQFKEVLENWETFQSKLKTKIEEYKEAQEADEADTELEEDSDEE